MAINKGKEPSLNEQMTQDYHLHYINIRNLLQEGTQNYRVWEELHKRSTLDCYGASRMNPPIMALHSRIADLRKLGAEIEGKTKYVNGVRHHTYWIESNRCDWDAEIYCNERTCSEHDCPYYPFEEEFMDEIIAEFDDFDEWRDEQIIKEMYEDGNSNNR